MNTKLFSEAINEIDGRYYEEAACYKRGRKKQLWVKWGAAAACLAVACAAAFSALPGYFDPQSVTPPSVPQGGPSPAVAEIHIDMGDIALNGLTGDVSGGDMTRLIDIWYDPALYDKVVWDEEALIDYYGKDLTPAYIPDGLTAAPANGTATAVMDKDGNVKEDTVWLEFYHDYYQDGSRKLTEDVAACKGFSMRVSKIGLVDECFYIMPENEVKESDIGGTKVLFGYRSMPYGPYDPETHEPSGYYDMYVAEFEHAGIAYELVAEQLEAEELVKVVSSIIYGKEVRVDK